MDAIVKHLPGMAGALAAFVALKLLGWTGLGYQLAAFLATYLIVTLLVDQAMRRYGGR